MTTIRSAATDAAARRNGADPELWHQVHDLHLKRSMVAVEIASAKLAGVITGIRNDGFKVGTFAWLKWGDVIQLVEVSP